MADEETTPVYDEFFTARIHRIEQVAMVPGVSQRAAIFCLVDASRKLRQAAQKLCDLYDLPYLESGGIKKRDWEAFREAVLRAYEDGDPFGVEDAG